MAFFTMAFFTIAFFTMAFFTMAFFTMTFFTMAYSETHHSIELYMLNLIFLLQQLINAKLQDLPTVVISGRMVSKDGLTNTKSIFMLVKNGETTYCNVEELVRDHYKVICLDVVRQDLWLLEQRIRIRNILTSGCGSF